jgi:surface-anchored protein
LPPNNTPGVPFLGIATEDLSAPFSSATLEMTGMAGPGNFALWQQVGFTTSVLMRSNDGIGGSGDTLTIPSIGSHDHYNFGFTEAGIYDITFEATAFNPDLPGGFATDTETFRFVVGDLTAIPEPSSFAAVTFFAAAGLLVRRRRKSKSTLQST